MNSNTWLFKKHNNDFGLLVHMALYLKGHNDNISKNAKEQIYNDWHLSNFYNPRKSKRFKPKDTINHKLDDLRNYMFGYYDKRSGQNLFMFSPLGNLLLYNIKNKLKSSKIFMTMLYAIQFPTTGNRSVNNLRIRPFRLIFKLLRDKRLGCRLYDLEVENILFFITRSDNVTYESIVNKILNYRHMPLKKHFQNMERHEFKFVNIVYQWQYYVKKILITSGVVINHNKDKKFVTLQHPQKKSSKSKPTFRKAYNSWFELSPSLYNLVDKLLVHYKWNEPVIRLNDPNHLRIEQISRIYSFRPNELLKSIGIDVNKPNKNKVNSQERQISNVLNIPHEINKYSVYNKVNKSKGQKGAQKFEKVLTKAFNLFSDVRASHMGAPGQTDVDCIYIINMFNKNKKDFNKKFAIDAKSTSYKLMSLNGRLKHHRAEIGAKYTIIVTPDYVPSVKYDIENTRTVIIKSRILSSYLYQQLDVNSYISYRNIDKIISKNLGTDISSKISNLNNREFGIKTKI